LYVEIASGGPFGAFLTALANERRRMVGIFVQMYGIQNEVFCRYCEMRLIKSENGIRYGMIFFFGCVFNARFNTACGNCLIYVEAAKCEFRDDRFACLRASWGRNPPLEWEITSANSPRMETFGVNELKGSGLPLRSRARNSGRYTLIRVNTKKNRCIGMAKLDFEQRKFSRA
jgi:hypothetical protein